MISRRLRLPRTRIEYLLKKGKRFGNDCIALKYLSSSGQKKCESRFCVIISARIEPKAVKRNRLRRQIHEIIRLNRHLIPSPCDIAIIGEKNITNLSYKQISTAIVALFKKIR